MNKCQLLKRSIIIILIICILMGVSNKVFAAMFSLNQIVDKFNTSNPMEEHLMDSYNASEEASIDGDRIILTLNNIPIVESKTLQVILNSEGNVLSTSISKAESTSTHHYMMELSMVWSLLDCIGQLNGYEKEEIYDILRDNKENKYTLSNNGFEINELSDSTEIKIDLDKKLQITNNGNETNEVNTGNTEDSNVDNNIKQNEANDADINKQVQNNVVVNNENKQDSTAANSKLPQTGVKNSILIIMMISFFVVISSIIVKRNKENRE